MHIGRVTMGGRRIGGIGGGAPASAAPWTPASVGDVLLWWHVADLESGAVATWTDRIAEVELAQATGTKQPVMNATALNGTPGVTSDGGDVLIAPGAGAVLAGLTQFTVILPLLDPSTAARIAIEYTENGGTTNGGWYISPNTGGADRLVAVARGTVGSTVAHCTEALATAKVVAVGFDLSAPGAGAVSFIRVDGVAQALTVTASASAAGVMADAALHLFARGATPSVGVAATGGDPVIRSGIAQDADLALIETYVATGGPYVRDLGRIMAVGDSITRSLNAATGGWRRELEISFARSYYEWTPVGPFVDASTSMVQKAHAGVNGDTAAARLSTIETQVTDANPEIIIWGFGVNDIGTGTAPATFLANMNALLDIADGIVPSVKHIVQSITIPTVAPGTGFLPEYAQANADLEAMCSTRARCTWVDVGAPATDDGVHPVDGPTGYGLMATPIIAAVLAVA